MGAGCRRFESCHSDQSWERSVRNAPSFAVYGIRTKFRLDGICSMMLSNPAIHTKNGSVP